MVPTLPPGVQSVEIEAAIPGITNPRFRSISERKIRKFMQLAGQDCPEQPVMPPRDVRILRARLILEEAFELIEKGLGVNVKVAGPPFGCREPFVIGFDSLRFDTGCEIPGGERHERETDMVELIDGIADLCVVAIGSAVAAGVCMAYPQDLVDDNNLAKFGPGGYRDENGKWRKPPGHQPPDIAGAINLQLGQFIANDQDSE